MDGGASGSLLWRKSFLEGDDLSRGVWRGKGEASELLWSWHWMNCAGRGIGRERDGARTGAGNENHLACHRHHKRKHGARNHMWYELVASGRIFEEKRCRRERGTSCEVRALRIEAS
jgi:hypothetical protein